MALSLPSRAVAEAVYEAMLAAAATGRGRCGPSSSVLDVILDAPHSAAARAVLGQRYGFTKVQSSAVMDVQFRRMTSADRENLEKLRADAMAEVAALEAEIDGN